MSEEDPRLRFRVWIAGRLVEQVWIDATNPDAASHSEAVQARHAALVAEAERCDQPWLIEIYDPSKPEHEAFLRIGTDTAGMVDPIPPEEP